MLASESFFKFVNIISKDKLLTLDLTLAANASYALVLKKTISRICYISLPLLKALSFSSRKNTSPYH